jgi:hypothetical protein
VDPPHRAVSRGRIESVVALALLVIAGGAYILWGTPTTSAPPPVPPPPSTAPTQVITAPESSTSASAGVPGCGPSDVDAVIRRWEEVGEVRVATVELQNIGGRTCVVWQKSQAGLYGNGELLVQGMEGSPRELVESGPGVTLRTRVTVRNYCGSKPKVPVTVAFLEGSTGFYVATPLAATDASGVPPCVSESQAGTIVMEAWSAHGSP